MRVPAEVTRTCDTFLRLVDAAVPGLVEALYLHGSVGFGDFHPGHSDIDFVAVFADGADRSDATLGALQAVHAEMAREHPEDKFEGIHLGWADLAAGPDRCGDVPYHHEGKFERAGRFELCPVTWHELADHGVVIRGPALTRAALWTDDAALRRYTADNLVSYWTPELRFLDDESVAARPFAAEWCVLGVSRLHHLLATGTLTSKTGAGQHALRTFDPKWHPVVHEALRLRAGRPETSLYADSANRGRDVAGFTAMALDAALALR